jgi:hypothetical protein
MGGGVGGKFFYAAKRGGFVGFHWAAGLYRRWAGAIGQGESVVRGAGQLPLGGSFCETGLGSWMRADSESGAGRRAADGGIGPLAGALAG